MSNEEKKLIIFDKDLMVEEDELIGEKRFIKFTDENRAVIYFPLIAPRYLNSYIVENGYEVCYEIVDKDVIDRFKDKIYTLTKQDSDYCVTKGVKLNPKRILLVDSKMNINLDLPKYKYEIVDGGFIISEIKSDDVLDSYCYVAEECNLNDELKRIMLPVFEILPGLLSVNTYSDTFERGCIKRKKRKNFNFYSF